MLITSKSVRYEGPGIRAGQVLYCIVGKKVYFTWEDGKGSKTISAGAAIIIAIESQQGEDWHWEDHSFYDILQSDLYPDRVESGYKIIELELGREAMPGRNPLPVVKRLFELKKFDLPEAVITLLVN